MKFLSGLKQAFSAPAIKQSFAAMGGGGAAGLAHLVLAKQVGWFTKGEYAYAKRAGAAVLIGLVGASFVKGKSTRAADGIQGAMGAVIAYELYNKFASGASYKFNGLAALGRTQARELAGTNVRNLNGLRGVGDTRSAAAARFL